jgi:predicted Ser/Thr protein kinase
VTDIESYRRAQRLFELLIDAPTAEREARLAAEDPALAALVRRLLAAAERSSGLDGALDQLASAVAAPELPELEGFRVLRELGRGGMGVVYEAEQLAPRRRVALKVMWRRGAVGLLRQEADAAARVEHPFVPRVHAVLERDGAPVIVMELVRGVDALTATAGWSLSRRLELLRDIARTLAAVHAVGVVHRDLKPSNVLVTEAGEPRVVDFGVAVFGEEQAAAGTPAFMAPELRAGGRATPASDVYALGVLGVELLTGTIVAPADDPAARLRAAGLARPVTAVVTQACAPLERRYASAQALADDLDRVLTHQVPRALPATLGERLGLALWRHRRRLAAGALVAAVATGAVLAALRGVEAVHEAEVVRAAREELEALVALAERASPEEVQAAFEALVQNPDLDGNEVVSDAWRWWAGRPEVGDRRAAASMAWLTATSAAQEQQGLTELAHQLVREGRWTALAAVLQRLPAAEPALRVADALGRWDVEAALQAADADTHALIAALVGFTPDAEPAGDGVFTPVGRMAVRDGVVALDATGAVTARWPLDGYRLAHAVWERDRLWWTGSDAAGRERVFSLAPGGTIEALETFPPGGLALQLGDTDGDGVLERHIATVPYDPARWRAEPADGPSVQVCEGQYVRALVIADLDGDGVDEPIVARHGRRQGVEILDADCGVRARLALFPTAVAPSVEGGLVITGFAVDDHREAAGGLIRNIPLLVRARWEGEALVPTQVSRLPRRAHKVQEADVDGDGRADVIVEVDGGTLIVGARGSPVLLPDLVVFAAGQADEDPAAELWVRGEGLSGLLGVGEGRLPARSSPPAPAPVGAPWFGLANHAAAWRRAEALAAAGLIDDAAAAFRELRRHAGPVSGWAAWRELELLAPVDPLAAVGPARALLARGELGAARGLALREPLRRAQDLDLLAHVEPEGPWPALRTRLEASRVDLAASAAWTVLRPAEVRRAAPGLRLEGVGPSPAVLRTTLLDVEDALTLELELEVEEQDWGTALVIELQAGDWRRTLSFDRGNIGPGSPSHHALHCLAEGGPKDPIWQPFAPGRRRVSLSWLRPAGFLRCALDGQARLQEDPGPPPGAPVVLTVGLQETLPGVQGLLRVGLTRLDVAGARIAAGDGSLLDDPAALQAAYAASDPLGRVRLGLRLGEPPALDPRLSDADEAALLRLDPSTWASPLLAARGPAFAALWLQAWEVPLHHRDPAASRALLLPALAAIPGDSAEAYALRALRARALHDAGDGVGAALALDGQLGEDPAAWELWALLLAERGALEAGRAALDRWLTLAPDRELAGDVLASEPALLGLRPWPLEPRPRITRADALAAPPVQ